MVFTFINIYYLYYIMYIFYIYTQNGICLLYTSDAADDWLVV